MLKAICEYTKSESFCFGNGFITRGSVRKHARKIGNFADPQPISLALDFDCEVAHR